MINSFVSHFLSVCSLFFFFLFLFTSSVSKASRPQDTAKYEKGGTLRCNRDKGGESGLVRPWTKNGSVEWLRRIVGTKGPWDRVSKDGGLVWVVGGLCEEGMGCEYADGSRCEGWDRAGCVGHGPGRVGVVARVGLHAEKLRHATHGALRPPGASGPNPHPRLCWAWR